MTGHVWFQAGCEPPVAKRAQVNPKQGPKHQKQTQREHKGKKCWKQMHLWNMTNQQTKRGTHHLKYTQRRAEVNKAQGRPIKDGQTIRGDKGRK